MQSVVNSAGKSTCASRTGFCGTRLAGTSCCTWRGSALYRDYFPVPTRVTTHSALCLTADLGSYSHGTKKKKRERQGVAKPTSKFL